MTYAEKMLDLKGYDPLEAMHFGCPCTYFAGADRPSYCPLHCVNDPEFGEIENKKCLRCWLREENDNEARKEADKITAEIAVGVQAEC